MGYRGHDYKGKSTIHVLHNIAKTASCAMRKWFKRRSGIEPTIGHLKSDHRLNRNYLKGETGDKINALLSAATYNFAKLPAWCYFARILLRSFTKNITLLLGKQIQKLGIA